jgi:hypothetical protein
LRKRFVLSQYHQGQVTVPRLAAFLGDLGIDISKRQIVRLLSAKQDTFLAEAIEVLRAGFASASWITVDDTSAQAACGSAPQTVLGACGAAHP